MPKSLRFIVLSHLRWNFVYQRPQHILARLAKSYPVIFIEEPIASESDETTWEIICPISNVTVARLHSTLPSRGFSDEQLALLAEKLQELDVLTSEATHDYLNIAWFYSPLAVTLLDSLKPDLVVFDSMDALDHFANAPVELREREAELLERADVVFTGGPSLQRRLEGRHANLHCFSSSVDAAHFQQAQQPEIDTNPRLPDGIKLGYVGVIDERIDLDLIAQVAKLRPQWQIVLVGPVAKIDPETLPQAPNIHYLGQQQYADLPGFIAGWDVCIQPFARNDATKYISPTKTLEFFAALKPVVSTSITDVAEPYGHIVFLADDAESFVAQTERSLDANQNQWQERVIGMREVLHNTSWDKTVSGMLKLVKIALDNSLSEKSDSKREDDCASGTTDQVALGQPSEANKFHIEWDVPTSENAPRSLLEDRSNRPAKELTVDSARIRDASVVVIGAGPTGLSATYHLKDQALLIEKNDSVGGWCRSLIEGGFTFDFAGHIMFSNDPYVHEMYKLLLGDNCHWQDREAWIYSHGVHTRYPFQGALYGLPPDVIRECIMGAIEARFGKSESLPAKESSKPNGAPAATMPLMQACSSGSKAAFREESGDGVSSGTSTPLEEKLFGDVKDCCADGVLESTAPLIRVHIVSESHSNGNGTSNGNGNGNGKENGNGSAHGNKNGKGHQNGNGASSGKLNSASQVNGTGTKQPANFEEFIYQVWGRGIAKHFAIPYNRKLWAVPLSEMETSWLGGRVPQPNLEEMIDGALQPVAKPQGPNARFGYPLQGGFQALMNGFLPHISENLQLNTRIARVSLRDRVIVDQTGREFTFEVLVSTMPLPLLIRAIGEEAPVEIQEAARKLRFVSVRCVNLGIGREKLTEKHWIYYPGSTVFHRIFVQGNASPHCNPAGGFGITCEITYSPHKPLPCEGDALIERCIQDCIEVGIMREKDPVWVANQVDMPFAYVVYDHARAKIVEKIRNWLKSHRILLAGRYSEWEYYNSDHAFVAGKRVAEEARALLQQQNTNSPVSILSE